MTDAEKLETIFQNTNEILVLLRARTKKKVSVARQGVTDTLQTLVTPYRGSTPPRELEKFLSYWTETDRKGTERWLKEKTWDTHKRLERWLMNVQDRQQQFEHRQQVKQTTEYPQTKRDTFVVEDDFSHISDYEI